MFLSHRPGFLLGKDETASSKRMAQYIETYDSFVEHPRYGKRPKLTGLNPRHDDEGVWLNPELSDDYRIPGTAIQADLSRQTPATYQVTHYFDVKRFCRDCHRRFIFFAEEQKHWYEELGFPLQADAARCPLCASACNT